ncbi:MAG: 30S ribosomal protein S1 [Planctomycetes bacterium]|nr:30S ribosomal protein S1 [Planctomycetota bacterium]
MAVNRLVKQFDLKPEDLDHQLQASLGDVSQEKMGELYNQSVQEFEMDKILKGKIVNVLNNDVIVDVGYKSEGVIPIDQFEKPEGVKEGDEIEVLLEAVEDEEGLIALSKRKADKIRAWERIITTHKEGDVVKGKVTRKIKGGLLIDIGVPVFLPASQIGIRRPGDIQEYVNQEMECKIIKIDESRMNIVVSRRKLLEEQRENQKRTLLDEIEIGQVRKGIVKNITEFGAFVDLGGIDGLLHITDMSWGRINHPSEVVQIDQDIEVKVLKVDKEKERISLGLKQKSESPWANIETKYPVGSKVKGKVVNVLSYGAFIQLEEGVEGLVHISEMSWTKRINHPNQMVNVGDDIEVVVLEIKKDKQEISLGMKQVDVNPWSLVEQKYPAGTIVSGKVRNLTNYGAFVEIEDGIDGLLHVADMSWTRKVVHPNEMLKKGDDVKAVVLQVDQERKRIALGLKQLQEDPWDRAIPDKYQVGFVVTGAVTKITNFGVFVRLEDDLEGLLHISELSNRKVGSPEEVVKVGDTVHVKVIKVDPENRKIGLSLKEVREEDLIAREEAQRVAHGGSDPEGEG